MERGLSIEHLNIPEQTPAKLFAGVSILVICFLSISTAISVVQSRDDPWTLAFVLFVYVLLMLLFWCLYVYDRNFEKRERLKIPIWVLATALNVVFAFRVAMIMNVTMKCVVWAMAIFSSSLGFYLFFIFPKKTNNCEGKSGWPVSDYLLDAKVCYCNSG